MEFTDYMVHMRSFHEVHGLPTDLEEIYNKLLAEMRELHIAVHCESEEEMKKECADVFNVVCRLLDRMGEYPPLAGYQKLVEAASRPEYVARRMDVAEGRR